jgi:DNA polymerase III delta prime subunit
MKFHETHFDEYINVKNNLHPKLEKTFAKFPRDLKDLKNLIFYGPSGVGKYTQMLKSISKYSPSELKYEKKISITYNKSQYYFKISDIHYEIDMSLLGCNSKLLWHEIYLQLIDIISAKTDKRGIIVCKYFHEIHSELLENFYSYMQQNNATIVDLKFVLLSEELSFIPDNILNCCEVIHIARPTKMAYNKCLHHGANKLPTSLEHITNIKNLHSSIDELMHPYKIICDKILDTMLHIEDMKYLKFRDMLYDIFIYNLDISECIWYIISCLTDRGKIKQEQMSELLIKTFNFFQYYNNNYRPIYHLENYLFYLVTIIHSFEK